jgi:hypothetical protein
MRLARTALLVLTALAAAAPALADPAGFAFLKVPAGARASGLSGAYASLADGTEGIFWNPAALEGVKGIQVIGSHYEYLEKLRHDQFAVGWRMLGGGVAASVRALYSEPIEERDALGNLIGTFGSHDLQFALGYGRQIAPGLRFGATGEAVRERIADEAAMTFAASAGTTWEPARLAGVRLSASVNDLGPAAHYQIGGSSGDPVRLPSAVQLGASYARPFTDGFAIRGALESRMIAGQGGIESVGAELAHLSGAAVRAGLSVGDTESSFSVGAGWAVQSLRLDYAFVPFKNELGDTHRLSFAAQF